MTDEPEQEQTADNASDETVIELVCRYTTTGPDADVATFIRQLTVAWGDRTGRGDNGTMPIEEHSEVRLHTSFYATEEQQPVVGEAIRVFGEMLTALPTVPGVALTRVTVEIIPGEDHAAHLDAVAAR